MDFLSSETAGGRATVMEGSGELVGAGFWFARRRARGMVELGWVREGLTFRRELRVRIMTVVVMGKKKGWGWGFQQQNAGM
jgi:hypothetical protein